MRFLVNRNTSKLCCLNNLNSCNARMLLLTDILAILKGNDQIDTLFLNVFISCLYMFRATSAHHQEDQLVSIHQFPPDRHVTQSPTSVCYTR